MISYVVTKQESELVEEFYIKEDASEKQASPIINIPFINTHYRTR